MKLSILGFGFFGLLALNLGLANAAPAIVLYPDSQITAFDGSMGVDEADNPLSSVGGEDPSATVTPPDADPDAGMPQADDNNAVGMGQPNDNGFDDPSGGSAQIRPVEPSSKGQGS